MTGRGMGYCVDRGASKSPFLGTSPGVPGLGVGRGLRRGSGFGRRRGLGMGRGFGRYPVV